MIDQCRQPIAIVVRQVPRPFLFLQEYRSRSGTWSEKRDEADEIPWEEADKLARKLTSDKVHVFPLVVSRAEATQQSDKRRDWRVGVPNAGVE